jgi:signal transduction histidine kinase
METTGMRPPTNGPATDFAEDPIADSTDRIEALERENAAVTAFAAAAAHELVEPLVVIEARAALIVSRLTDEGHEAVEDLQNLGRAAARLRWLVEAILHDARSGAEGLRLEAVDLNAVARDVLAMMDHEIERRGVQLEIEALPTVRGDEALLSSLLTNLITNAIKYGRRRGGGRVQIRAEREQSAWRVTVDDDGPPISADDRTRIFEPYQRARHERRLRGSGLGLFLCRQIVQRHGGEIGVGPGALGNAFFFTLPD